jgi:AcrR family transcriptional regulator
VGGRRRGPSAPTARGGATQRRIVQAARRVMVQRGAGGLTLRSVAAKVGISLSNLQFHFRTQEDLLRAVLDAEMQHAESFVLRWLAANPDDPIGSMIDALLALQRERDSARLFFSMWSVATTSAKLRKALHGFYSTWTQLTAASAAPAAQANAWLFVALLEGSSLFRCGVIGKTSSADDEALRRSLRALLGYGGKQA